MRSPGVATIGIGSSCRRARAEYAARMRSAACSLQKHVSGARVLGVSLALASCNVYEATLLDDSAVAATSAGSHGGTRDESDEPAASAGAAAGRPSAGSGAG